MSSRFTVVLLSDNESGFCMIPVTLFSERGDVDQLGKREIVNVRLVSELDTWKPLDL